MYVYLFASLERKSLEECRTRDIPHETCHQETYRTRHFKQGTYRTRHVEQGTCLTRHVDQETYHTRHVQFRHFNIRLKKPSNLCMSSIMSSSTQIRGSLFLRACVNQNKIVSEKDDSYNPLYSLFS